MPASSMNLHEKKVNAGHAFEKGSVQLVNPETVEEGALF